MCRVGDLKLNIGIYAQLKEGDYEVNDYILVDTNGEIQAVSGNSDFWEDGVVPRRDYIALKVVRFINPDIVSKEGE